MSLTTISREINLAEADLKFARLEAAGYHPFILNESSSLYLGTALASGGYQLQVPEPEAESALDFLNSPVEPLE